MKANSIAELCRGLVVRKTSTRRFLLKAIPLTALVVALGAAFFSRFHIAMDIYDPQCLPDTRIYLIDRWNKTVERDGLYLFRSRGLEPIWADGQGIIKIARGLTGDTVEVRADETVHINGHFIAFGLGEADQVGYAKDHFIKTGNIASGYWMLGTSPRSFDSRYWGSVQDDQIIGRAYPVF